MVDFLISTKSPIFTFLPTLDSGLRYANGPTVVPSSINDSTTLDISIETLPETVESTILASGPITQHSPITVFPSMNVPGYITESLPITTESSMYVRCGSIMVTPETMSLLFILSLIISVTSASCTRSFTAFISVASSSTQPPIL